jgi:hypothetical protein
MTTKKPFLILSFALGMTFMMSCSRDRDGDHNQPGGKVDFSRYISVGNSLTAGSADKGLYLEGQQNSYPEIFARQMKQVGGGDFASPLFAAGQENGSGYLRLTGISPNGTPQLEAVATNLAIRGQITGPKGEKINLLTKYTGALNNFGVPSIRLSDVTSPEYGNINEYFERLLPANPPMNKISYLDFVTEKPFTFFTCWLGSNDVLLYAATGASSQADYPTDKATFEKIYHTVADKLVAKGAKGVLVTVPDITKSAFLNAVSYASLLKTVQAVAPGIKDLYIQTGDASVRAATAEDLFTLSLGVANLVGVPDDQGRLYGLDPANPIKNAFVLDKTEVVLVKDFTDSYNAVIRSIAKSKNLALYDAFADLNQIVAGEGITENGIKFTSAFITGNLFSLDGVHLTPRGYAHIANQMIKATNDQYKVNIPLADVSKFRGVKTP